MMGDAADDARDRAEWEEIELAMHKKGRCLESCRYCPGREDDDWDDSPGDWDTDY